MTSDLLHDARLFRRQDRAGHALVIGKSPSAQRVSGRAIDRCDDQLMRVRIVEKYATRFRAGRIGRVRRDATQEVVEIEEGRERVSGGRRSAEIPGVRHDACILDSD